MSTGQPSRSSLVFFNIQSPSILCLNENIHTQNTLSFFSKIEDTLERGHSAEISFSVCTEIRPLAALLLFSTINNIQVRYGFTRVKINIPSRGTPLYNDSSLMRSGLWDALTCKNETDIENLILENNRFKTSQDPSIIKRVEEILRKIENLSAEHVFFLTMAIKEAVLNVIHHAYKRKESSIVPEAIENRWWQCAWVNIRKKEVNIIIHDRGVGILGTYNDHYKSSEELLLEAMQQGISSTGLTNRGMGSEDMKSPVNQLTGTQKLTIYTERYVYSYSSCILQPAVFERKDYICGTLVHWECTYDD
ncbi:Uncharacterised protein [Serratia fonticola]|uniref:ATP-binding protein n=1 Tax=Serratia fonticola TaxID=47917 RepID=UPI00217A50D4|nr:ATP-binding protein [Serratia fonticola]CAI0693193.1 Uncharacterised protein [Serratia fonticola]